MTIEQLLQKLSDLRAAEARGEDVSTELAAAQVELDQIKAQMGAGAGGSRRGSRFPSTAATDDVLDMLAAGGSIQGGQLLGPGEKFAAAVAGGDKSLAGHFQKALAEGVPAAGGVLVPTQIAAAILTLVRARSAVFQLGPTVQPVKKELAINSIASGAKAEWVGENEPVMPSEPEFDQDVLLKPKELAGLIAASKRVLRDAAENPNLDAVLRAELAEVLALAADKGYIEGPGTGNQPKGILKQAGLTPAPDLGANGAVVTFDNLKDMVANLRMANATFQKPGWIFNPRLINTLEKVKDKNDRYLADAGLLTFDATGGGGTLLGYRFATTTQLPVNVKKGTSEDTTSILLGSDWQEAWIGVEEALTINVSTEASYEDPEGKWHSAFQSRQALFLAESVTDIGLRRPQWFTAMSGVRA